MRTPAAAAIVAILTVLSIAAQAPPPAQPPVEQPRPATPAPAPAPPKPRPRPAQSATSSISVRVTDSSGLVMSGVQVAAAGPVARSGVTDAQGTVRFVALRPGTYRLRFEHQKIVTLEREVAVRGGQPADIDVSLTAAPPPPPPPPAPKPEPAAPVRMAVKPPDFRTIAIPDYVERNLIGSREPSKTSVLACGATATTSLVQVREPLKDRLHADADEFLYVVGGQGLLAMPSQDVPLEAGTLALVPRGAAHSVQRRGRGVLVLMSTLTDTPCSALKP